jgi:hypothetical protein
LKNKIVPLLRSQRGFQEQITLFIAKRDHAISISFWDDEQSANDYNHVVYLDVLRALSGVADGLPVVEIFEDAEPTPRSACRAGGMRN